MSTPFLGEIRIFGFNFSPRGWAMCDGQILAISQNTALFSLIGTFYGGNGSNTFALPDLQSRVAVGIDSNGQFPIGSQGGEETHTLTINEIPLHSHTVKCRSTIDSSGTPTSPVGNYWAKENNGDAPYAASGTLGEMHASAVGNTGGNQSHTNIQPYLTMTFCIALEGIFPSRN
jgi:microcystin-dependent protein